MLAQQSCSLESKVYDARRVLGELVKSYTNPIVMSSFGKDSVVLLDLVDRCGFKLPVLFHREPFCPEKYSFANSVIREKNYTVYDYAPSSTFIMKNGSVMEIASCYQSGAFAAENTPYHWLPTGIKMLVEGQEFLCGYKDIYQKPKGTFNFPWDVCLVGHKSSDVDPILGSVPLEVDIKKVVGGADYAFPLRYFTDEDIWEYVEKYGVPYDKLRYDVEANYTERESIRYNPDYFYACTKCIDRDEEATVFCPKLQVPLVNISSEVRYVEPLKPDYIGAKHVV